jgi:hypothetical protein
LPNLAKYIYEGLPLEQYQKIEKKNTRLHTLVIVWMEDQFCKDIYHHLFQMTKDMGPE